jgi:hypothetical protein
MVLRLFGCLASLDGPLVTNSPFSQTCLSPSPRCVASFSCGEGGDVKHTFMGGLLAGHGRLARPLSQRKHTQQQQGGMPVQRAG